MQMMHVEVTQEHTYTHLHTLTHAHRRGTAVASGRVLKDTAGGTLTEQESMSGPRLPACPPDDTRATQHAPLRVCASKLLNECKLVPPSVKDWHVY